MCLRVSGLQVLIMGRGCRQEEAGGCGPVPAAVVVIFASFLSNLLFNGVSYCSGIFFANFLETFNAGTSATAGVISLQNCSLYFAGTFEHFLHPLILLVYNLKTLTFTLLALAYRSKCDKRTIKENSDHYTLELSREPIRFSMR